MLKVHFPDFYMLFYNSIYYVLFDQQQEDEAAELEGGSISSLVTDGNKRCDK